MTMETNDVTDGVSQEHAVLRKRKRDEGSSEIDESAGDETKQSRKELKIMDQRLDSADLISQLPDHIIHHILSMLRCKKDAARTSILSRKWRAIWFSFLILDFDQCKFEIGERNMHYCSRRKNQGLRRKKDRESRMRKERFRNFVDNTLQSRTEEQSGIKKFSLRLTSYDFESAVHIDRWIGFVTENNIQELDLFVPKKKNRCYSLPQTVFAAKMITSLRIFGCKLDACNDVKFSHLQKLCLGKLYVDDQKIQILLVSCPLIEDLRLIYCRGLKSFSFSSNRLSRVDLHLCDGLKKVEIEAPSLQTFWYHGKKNMSCKIHMPSCKSLRHLTLKDAKLTNDLFQNLLPNFPVLEQLVLSKCNAIRSVTISSHWLKTLVVRECENLKEADIDTPSLLSFEYKGDKMPFSSFNPSGLQEAKLHFQPSPQVRRAGGGLLSGQINGAWVAELHNFLGKFNPSKDLKLVVRSKKNVIVHENLKQVFIPPVEDLALEIIKSSISLKDIVDKLLRTWHPVTLCIVSSTLGNLDEQVYLRMFDREEKPSCCTYNTKNNKCWRHFLKDVNIENLDSIGEASYWIACLKSSASVVNQMTCFRMNWKKAKHVQ